MSEPLEDIIADLARFDATYQPSLDYAALPPVVMEPVEVRDVDLIVTGEAPHWQVRRVSAPPGRKADLRGELHDVQLVNGRLECDCKGWEYKKICRHVSAVRNLIEDAG